MNRYFAPVPQVYDYLCKKVKGKNVLELGPGKNFFPAATEFGGHLPSEAESYAKFKKFDFCEGLFPYKDKEFDFVVARHVVEDLYNPIHFLKECKRIAKAGYIETPSPMVEITKHIEQDKAVFTGYHHHHSFVWTKGNEINILHKFPIVEHGITNLTTTEYLKDPFFWNNYFLWEGDFEVKHWRHEVNYLTINDYPQLIVQGINESATNTQKFKEAISDSTKAN